MNDSKKAAAAAWFDLEDAGALLVWAMRGLLVLFAAAVCGISVRIFLITSGLGG